MAWLEGWTYRKSVAVQDANVDSDLTDFSALYVPFKADADFAAALATGYDIRFTLADGETLLYYERESWTGGNGSAATADFWVRVPSIAATGGANLYIYYGNAGAADGQSAANVWTGAASVHHLKESYGTGAGNYKDSTANANHATLTDANANSGQGTGIVGKCIDLNGDADGLNAGSGASYDGTGPLTLSCWVKMDSIGDAAADYFLAKDRSGTLIWAFFSYDNTNNNLVFQWLNVAGGSGSFNRISADASLNTGVWMHLAARFDGGNLYTGIKLYRDGAELGYKDGRSPASHSDDTAASLYIGNRYDGARPVDGLVDEVRVYLDDRGAAWIKFEYRNVAEADNELTWGDEEAEPTPTPTPITPTPTPVTPTPTPNTLEAALRVIAPVYRLLAPKGAVLPYIVLTRAGGTTYYTFPGGGIESGRLEVAYCSRWAGNDADALDVMRLIVQAIDRRADFGIIVAREAGPRVRLVDGRILRVVMDFRVERMIP